MRHFIIKILGRFEMDQTSFGKRKVIFRGHNYVNSTHRLLCIYVLCDLVKRATTPASNKLISVTVSMRLLLASYSGQMSTQYIFAMHNNRVVNFEPKECRN